MELEFAIDLDSYSGGRLAAGRVTHARQVLGKLLDSERYLGPLDRGLCVRLTFSPCKNLTVSTPWQNQGGSAPKNAEAP